MWDTATVSTTAEEAHAAWSSAGRQKSNPAENFLREYLSEGPRKSSDVDEAAFEQMITKRSLDRAKARIGAKAFKQKGVLDGDWFVRLPGQANPYDEAPETHDNTKAEAATHEASP